MKRIRNRIFVQILFPVLSVYVLIIGGGVSYMSSSFKDAALAQKEIALDNIVRGIDDWLLFRVSEVLQLSRIPLFKGDSEDASREYLKEWQDRLSFYYDSLLLVEESGAYWNTAGEEGFLEDTSYTSLFFEDKMWFTYAGPHRFGDVLEDHFVIGAPVFSLEGEVKDVLTATIQLSTLRRIFGFFTFEDFDSWMVVNPRSIIITHHDPEMAGLSERGEYSQTFLENGVFGDSEVFVQTMRNGWKVVAFLKTDKILQPYRQAYTLIIAFSVVMFLIVIGFVLLLSSYVALPVLRLNTGVNKIMKGDYSQEIILHTQDELADLAASFNRLAKRMTARRTEDRFAFLGHIAARVAHELRRPLHLIQLSVQNLEQGRGDEKRFLSIIEQEVENADQFIREVLNFAHDDELDKELYSLDILLGRVKDKFDLIASEFGVEISFSVLSSVPQFYMDVFRMEEVFSNILQNACEAISEADGELMDRKIAIEMSLSPDKEVMVVFTDSGPGFDKAVMDQLFDPYFTTRDKGTGLGLSLCYRVVMAHGGRILLENTGDNHGRVSVIFPL